MALRSKLWLFHDDLVLGFQSRVLELLLLLTAFKRGDFGRFNHFILLPRLLIGQLLPLAVFDPRASIRLVVDGEAPFGMCLVHLHHASLHRHPRQPNKESTYLAEVRVVLVRLQSELQSHQTLAASWQLFIF